MYGKRLKELRKIEGWTQEEVSKKLGVSKQTYSHYENEKRRPSLDTIRELAVVYQVDIDDIFAEGQERVSDLVSIPIVGRVSCGNGILAYEEIEGYEATPRDWVKGGEYFYVRAKGDSMINARIHDGDLLLIRQQPEVENGQIAAVLLDRENVVLKRVHQNGEQLTLLSENPAYDPIFTTTGEVRILGKLAKALIEF